MNNFENFGVKFHLVIGVVLLPSFQSYGVDIEKYLNNIQLLDPSQFTIKYIVKVVTSDTQSLIHSISVCVVFIILNC